MRLLWCHLQFHHFKGTKAPRCPQHKEQVHPLTSSFVLLSPNGNSPAESPYTVKGELHSVLYNQVFLGFCPLALTVHHCNNDKLSLSLFPLSDMKETTLVRKFVCTYICLFCAYEWVHLQLCTRISVKGGCVCCQSHDYSAAGCLLSKSSHWKCSQAGYDVMRQGDNTTTTLVHGYPLKDPNEIMRSYGRYKAHSQNKNPLSLKVTVRIQYSLCRERNKV